MTQRASSKTGKDKTKQRTQSYRIRSEREVSPPDPADQQERSRVHNCVHRTLPIQVGCTDAAIQPNSPKIGHTAWVVPGLEETLHTTETSRLSQFYWVQTVREEMMPVRHHLFQKTREKGMPPSPIHWVSIMLYKPRQAQPGEPWAGSPHEYGHKTHQEDVSKPNPAIYEKNNT